MIDPSLQSKILEIAAQASSRANQVDLKALWKMLSDIDPVGLRSKLRIQNLDYSYGALPIEENPGFAFRSEAEARPVIGIDGSQIYPSVLHPVRWAYIQALAYGLSCPIISKTEFLDLELRNLNPNSLDERQDDKGNIDFLRTILELKVALKVIQTNPDALIFMDYPLLPWIHRSDPSYNIRIKQYVDIIDKMRGKLVVGIVSAPRSQLLINLLGLSEKLNGRDGNCAKVSDTALACAGLEPGQRSAIFTYAGPRNEVFHERGIEICFFFILIDHKDVARVEIPNWIARDPACVDLVHSSILNDSLALGYSYCLARAHQEVAISLEVASSLHELATREYISKGGYIYESAKIRAKGY